MVVAGQAADQQLTDVAANGRWHANIIELSPRRFCVTFRLVLSFVFTFRFVPVQFRSSLNPDTNARPETDLHDGHGETWSVNDRISIIPSCASRPQRRPASISRAAPSTSGRSISFTPARRRSTPRSASAPARASRPRADTRIVIRSEDTGATVEADDWRELRDRPRAAAAVAARALLRGARHHADDDVASRRPAPGIAGSSALNVAVCAALAEWKRTHYEPEALLQIAMNVEAQAINVPTGLQDYRPALYGGIAALELDVDGIRRVPLDVDLARARAAHRALLHRRAAQLRHQQLGDHQEAHRRRPPRLRLLRAHPRHGGRRCARRSSAATGTRSAAPSPTSGTTASGWRPA